MEMDDLMPIPGLEVIEEIDDIHGRILLNINDRYDKTEGQFPWDESRPMAIEVQNLQIRIQNDYYNTFLNSSMDSESLTFACRELRTDRKPSVKSSNIIRVEGTDGTIIPTNTTIVFYGEEVVEFVSTEDVTIATGTADVPFECTVGGAIGNVAAHSLTQFKEPISGVTSVTNPQAFDNGIDEESDEALLKRTLEAIRNPGFSGNPAQCKQWAMSVPGVDNAKIYETYNNTNVVKYVLMGVDGRSPSQGVLDNAYAYIESVRPAGARTLVVGVTEVLVNITATVISAANSDVDRIKAQFIPAATEYFKSLSFVDQTVRLSKLVSVLGDIPDVIDYSNFTMNGAASNIILPEDAVAVLGTVTFTV